MEYNREYTPEFITELKTNEIFVFGSNIRGMHGGGAARIANKKFGAEWGVGECQKRFNMIIKILAMINEITLETKQPFLSSSTSFFRLHKMANGC